MKKLTAEKCRELLQIFTDMKEEGHLSLTSEYHLQAYRIALPALELHDVDSEALAVSHEIMRIMYDNMIMPAGGSSRLMAQVQCLVIDAMKVAQGDKSLSRQPQESAKSHGFSAGGYVKEKPKAEEVMAIVDSGWIEWGGSPCPVANNTDVEVRRGDGYVVRGKAADFYWQTRGLLGSVIAYRVIENDGGAE